MTRLPVVLWLLIHAAKSIGWEVEWELQSASVTVVECCAVTTRKPRRWKVSARELPDEKG